MKFQLSIILFSALLGVAAQAAAEDVTIGTILALDRKANLMIFADRSTWSLEELESGQFAEMKAGDQVEVSYESDEDGIGKIISIKLVPTVPDSSGAADINEGLVLAYDRRANILVMSDRTVWALELSRSPVPAGLKSGDRVRIEYDSDEDGVSLIYGIEILSD